MFDVWGAPSGASVININTENMPKKKYRSIHFKSLSIPVVMNHRTIFCEFTGGRSSPVPQNGMYSTSDESIQKQLESSPAFNIDYKLESQKLLDGEVMVGKKVAEIVKKEEPKKSQEDIENDAYDIKNFMSAKSYLSKKMNVPWDEMPNKQAVLDKAKELGVVFSSWK